MAKILSFRSKQETSEGQTYLTDEAEKLSFHTAEDGAVSLDEVSSTSLPQASVYTDPQKDWSNQELADLFRVRQLLSGANVPVETMRGVTDEGDPWFIFCHFNGDVFIHMARIDGLYVLDSPNVRRPLRGRDFNGLIADFTSDALPSYDKVGEGDTSAPRVIRLERGGKVQLHPSAMLAALIWTLFLASEELVMLAPEEQTANADDLLDFTDIITADAEFAALETDAQDDAGLSQADSFKIDHEETIHTAAPAAETQGSMREVMGQQGVAMQQNAYAMGLSTIAIAMGFMSEVVLMDNQRKVLDGLAAIGIDHTETDTNNPELDQIAGTSSDALMAKLAAFLGLDLSLNTETAEAPQAASEGSLLQQDMLHVTTTTAAVVEDTPLPPAKVTQTVAREQEDAAASDVPEELPQTTNQTEELILIAAAEQQNTTINMADLVSGALKMEEFQLGQTTVMASFDVNGNDAFSLSDYLFVGQRTSDHRAFDDRAQAFIDFIQAKDTDVGVITIGNEIIMIDRGAFLDASADTYSFSWETGDGQVISMIGLKSEFQEFDLIA